MFRKAHLSFTLLFTGVATAIMICMSFFYLQVSENTLLQNHFRSFQNDIGTIITSLEQSSSVSMQWLAKLNAQNNYIIYIVDNGVPFLYNKLQDFDSSSQSLPEETPFPLIEESLTAYDAYAGIEAETLITNAYYGVSHSEFEFDSASLKASFYCSLITLEKNKAQTQIIILTPTESLHRQIQRQRRFFVLINVLTFLALAVFSWFFTGKLLKPLKENQKRQNQFIAAASHELRTPLSVILANDECCQNAPENEQAAFHHIIQKEGRRMSSLIDELLTIAHTELDRFSLNPVPTEPDTLCMRAYEAFEPLAREKKVQLKLILPETVCPRCSLDPDRIMQVLSALLHNAITYTPEGGRITLSLTFASSAKSVHGGHLYISIVDNGIGIPDADKKHVFERFYRTEKSRSAKGHFGLGLAIASEIVTAHRGKISVRDNPGGGSIFTVELPV